MGSVYTHVSSCGLIMVWTQYEIARLFLCELITKPNGSQMGIYLHVSRKHDQISCHNCSENTSMTARTLKLFSVTNCMLTNEKPSVIKFGQKCQTTHC